MRFLFFLKTLFFRCRFIPACISEGHQDSLDYNDFTFCTYSVHNYMLQLPKKRVDIIAIISRKKYIGDGEGYE